MYEHELKQMSSRLNSSVKLTQYPEYQPAPESLETPHNSLCKQDPRFLSLRKSGVKSPQRQESISRAVVPIRQFDDIPPRDQSRAFNFITMGRFNIGSTIIRVRVFTWLLLLTIKVVSILTAAAFWLATALLITNLSGIYGTSTVLCSALRYLEGPQIDIIWRQICLNTGYLRVPHLRLTVYASNSLRSPLIYSTSMSIPHEDPLLWFYVMVLMFICHFLTCFAHDCLSKLKPDDT